MAGLKMPQTYYYSPLNAARREIRILEVPPGLANAPLSLRMRAISLRDDHELAYEAVSYCWQTVPGRATIEIDGLKTLVTASSAAAIRRLRYPDRSRTLWIDAVCINQEDVRERSQQVSLMGEIYRRSWGTLVWLGELADGADAASVQIAVDAVVVDMKKLTDNYATLEDRNVLQKILLSTHPGPRQNAYGPALMSLFGSPWFERLWVVQEVALASTCRCHYGSCEWPLDDVLKAGFWAGMFLTHFGIERDADIAGLSAASDLSEYMDDYLLDCDMYSLLTLSANRLKTDPRDSLYAVLGLTKYGQSGGGLPHLLAPDYSKSVNQVRIDAAGFVLSEESDMSYLNGELVLPAECDETFDLQNLPSWVPVLDMPRQQPGAPAPLPWLRANQVFPNGDYLDGMNLADGHRPILVQERTLRVAGVQLDRIGAATTTHYVKTAKSSRLDFVEDAARLLRAAESSLTESHIDLMLLAALTAGRSGDIAVAAGTALDGDEHIIAAQKLRRFVEFERSNNEGTTPRSSTARVFKRDFDVACTKRRFFITVNGSAGVGPRRVESGDIIAALYGAALPFVLRKCAEGYTLLGPAYLSQLNLGDSVSSLKKAGRSDETFDIV